MHTFLVRLLEHRQLSHAGQLFTISDYDVITDLHDTLSRIKSIFNAADYTRKANDQSVVEIVLARITAAIRETNSIDAYAPILVDTLGSCLCHEMTHIGRSGIPQDTPHCKIACELLNSLFLHYSKKSVMTVTVPTAIRALSCGSDELTRNTTSYLSLAAIHNGHLLAQYSIQIINNILNGNYPLVRVVPQLYPENREPYHAHFSKILKLLKNDRTDQSERLSVLQFASMVANANPDLILGYLDDLDVFLLYPTTRTAILHIYLSLISLNRTSALTFRLDALRKAATMISDSDDTLLTMAKIIGVIGRLDPKTASIAVNDLITISRYATESLPILLKEIEGLAECYPNAVLPHLRYIRSLPKKNPLTTAVCDRIHAFCSGEGQFRQSYFCGPTSEDITVVSVLNATGQSDDSLISRISSRAEAPPVISSGVHTTVNISDSAEFSAQELDKNTENLANVYSRLRSSCSLTNQTSRSYGSLNPHNENVNGETASRGSPVVPSQASRRFNGAPYVPVYPPPSYHSPKGHTFPQTVLPTIVQMGKDGRVRPMIIHTRRNASHWFPSSSNPPPYETTFPVNASPANSKISQNSGTMTHTIRDDDSSRFGITFNDMQKEHNADIGERGDVVQQFVNHRRSNIQNFVNNFCKMYPIPVQCTVEGSKHRMRVHFRCQICDPHCMYNAEQMFSFKTRVASLWLHLMFLQMEATSIETTGEVIAQSSEAYQTLSNCWHCLPHTVTHTRPFSELVTSAFPAQKEQQQIKKELCEANYFESFSYNAQLKKWSCFSCSHPERVRTILQPDSPHLPVLEGQLKEKRGRWKFLKRWHTKYFTLSSATLSCREESSDPATDQIISPSIELRKIRSVKSLTKGRKSRKSLPKAFEIFTEDDVSYVLKANDQSKAEEWIQWLQIAVAQAHKER